MKLAHLKLPVWHLHHSTRYQLFAREEAKSQKHFFLSDSETQKFWVRTNNQMLFLSIVCFNSKTFKLKVSTQILEFLVITTNSLWVQSVEPTQLNSIRKSQKVTENCSTLRVTKRLLKFEKLNFWLEAAFISSSREHSRSSRWSSLDDRWMKLSMKRQMKSEKSWWLEHLIKCACSMPGRCWFSALFRPVNRLICLFIPKVCFSPSTGDCLINFNRVLSKLFLDKALSSNRRPGS